VRQVVNQHQSNLLEKGVTFAVYAEVDVAVRSEDFLLEAALNNLVQNAIDFSPTGGAVKLSLEKRVALFNSL
ncbi:MAG: hypothetical protein ABF322_08430, partial [Lentimonas sp.]